VTIQELREEISIELENLETVVHELDALQGIQPAHCISLLNMERVMCNNKIKPFAKVTACSF